MRYRSFVLSLLTAVVLTVGGLGSVAAQDASPAAEPPANAMLSDTFGLPELQITLTDAGFEGVPAETAAGWYAVTFTNNATVTESAAIDFVQLPEGRTIEDLVLLAQLASAEGEGEGNAAPAASPESMEGMDTASPAAEDPFAWLYETYISGGPGAEVGQTVQGIVELRPGNLAAFDDNFGPFPPVAVTVTGDATASPAAADQIAATATVTETGTSPDFAFEVSGTLAAGPGLIEVYNDADQPHFMEMIYFPDAITDAQFEALLNFDPSLGTPPPAELEGIDFETIGTGGFAATQSPDSTQYLAVNLEPGYYVLACFIPDPVSGGIPHAFEGMYAIVQVS